MSLISSLKRIKLSKIVKTVTKAAKDVAPVAVALTGIGGAVGAIAGGVAAGSRLVGQGADTAQAASQRVEEIARTEGISQTEAARRLLEQGQLALRASSPDNTKLILIGAGVLVLVLVLARRS